MVESGETWFWSRSRQELWHKGATSGNTQQVVSIHYDCDGDTLLVKVNEPDATVQILDKEGRVVITQRSTHFCPRCQR